MTSARQPALPPRATIVSVSVDRRFDEIRCHSGQIDAAAVPSENPGRSCASSGHERTGWFVVTVQVSAPETAGTIAPIRVDRAAFGAG
jgi:hypothetical protein